VIQDKSDKQYRGYMEIEWVRTAYISKENADDQFQFGIRFIKNGKYSDLWTNSEEDYQKWKLALAQVCIQCDFHVKFNAIKMIGKGSFARVRFSLKVGLLGREQSYKKEACCQGI
jgi:hypothetical protein